MPQISQILKLSSSKIAGIYAIAGGIWILASDWLVLMIAETESGAALLQTIKGWFFVVSSTALIFLLTQIRERQLEQSQDRLIRASQELQVFHRIFRHNIRNDLNVIQGYTQLVRNNIRSDEDKNRLETVVDTAERLIEISRKLRLIEKPELQAENNSLIDLSKITAEECKRLQDDYPDLSVESDLPENMVIRADQSVVFAIRELLENAVEHNTKPPQERQVTVSGVDSTTKTKIEIRDNGPGIPRSEIKAIRTGEQSQLVHSSGVGLWLTTWLCRLYDGDIHLEANENNGTVVTLEFEALPSLNFARSESGPLQELTDVYLVNT